jgi:hypothetical protein
LFFILADHFHFLNPAPRTQSKSDPEIEFMSPHLDAGLLLDELQELGALGHGGVQDGALLFQALRRKKIKNLMQIINSLKDFL